MDGTGYPQGLKGDEIPLSARIFAAVDICDAVLSDRPYRKGWPVEKAREYIRSLSGSHLDPRVVEALLPMIGAPDWPMPKVSNGPADVRCGSAGETDSERFGAAFRAMLEQSDDFVVLLDGSWRIQAASRSFAATFTPGRSPRELDFTGLLHSGSQNKFRTIMNERLDGSRSLELNHLTPSKTFRLVSYSICESSDPSGARLFTAVGRSQDASLELVEKMVALNQELEESRRTLAEQALSDPLTGLGNRRWLFDQLDTLWAQAKRQGRLPWILMADLDHFKTVNDTYGHQVGDEVLLAASRTMRQWVRTEDVVARYGGEEFVIAGLCDHESEALEVADRILTAVRETRLECSGGPLCVTSSIGVALAEPDLSNPPWVVLQSADRALYRAKAKGRDRIEFEPGTSVPGRRMVLVDGRGGLGTVGFCCNSRAS